MSTFVKLSCLFCLGCSAGWVLELFFRRFFSKNNVERKWINPGFLYGPWLPLYGFGLIMLYLLAGVEPYLPLSGWIAKLVLFLIMAVCMTAIEYIAGIISVKLLKVHLWDYSDEWGNIGGIICPKFSLFWAILGALYYFLIHPNIINILDWMSNNLAFSLVIGFYLGIFTVDVVYSCNLLAKIRQFANENQIVLKYDKFCHIVNETMEKRKHRRRRFFTPLSHVHLSDDLKNYLEWWQNNAKIVKEVIEEKKRK